MFRWHPNEAHNGYLEIYLTLGLIGLFILGGVFVRTFWKIRFELFRNFEWGRYRLGFFVAVVLYNWTEAAVRAFHPVWFVFYIIAIDYPRTRLTTAEQRSQRRRRDQKRAENLPMPKENSRKARRYLGTDIAVNVALRLLEIMGYLRKWHGISGYGWHEIHTRASDFIRCAIGMGSPVGCIIQFSPHCFWLLLARCKRQPSTLVALPLPT